MAFNGDVMHYDMASMSIQDEVDEDHTRVVDLQQPSYMNHDELHNRNGQHSQRDYDDVQHENVDDASQEANYVYDEQYVPQQQYEPTHVSEHVEAAHDLEQQATPMQLGPQDANQDERQLQDDMPDADRIQWLQDELDRTRQDRDDFENQYRGLLSKLTTMRNTLGDKLRQDADELDRRGNEINELRATNEDLSETVETLKNELIQANEDSEHAHTELERLRQTAFDSQRTTSDEATERELALRDLQEDLERVRNEREEWESEAMRERVRREEAQARLNQLELELAQANKERETLRHERDREAESASNLHAVLEEFQEAKERELNTTLRDLSAQLQESNDSLIMFKERAKHAETALLNAQDDSEKVNSLTKQVKDQSLLIGKLRHEAVILNEHLTEALRRLKKGDNEASVDRRLVSNVLISFLLTPRGDSKRFEMLQVLSSILSWTDDQREQVGLQRTSALSAPGVISGRRSGRGHARSGKGKETDDGMAEESFSNLWIEFLLKESGAGGGKKDQQSGNGAMSPTSAPTSPTGRYNNLPDLTSPQLSNSRRPSLTSYFSRGMPIPAAQQSSIKEEG
ncbi:hypothetical protein OIO90_002091 [Microbotryomycetes sp. JL221]|nr:hypothetical protein OIO90_002091 [Microbotryomycetes sp. JL221]